MHAEPIGSRAANILDVVSRYETRVVEGAFDEVLERTRKRLEEEGFHVLYDVDLRDRPEGEGDPGPDGRHRCRVLGAGDPRMTGRPPGEEVALDVLLSGRVVVYENGDGTVFIGAVDPHPSGPEDDPETEVADEQMSMRLAHVVESVVTDIEVFSE